MSSDDAEAVEALLGVLSAVSRGESIVTALMDSSSRLAVRMGVDKAKLPMVRKVAATIDRCANMEVLRSKEKMKQVVSEGMEAVSDVASGDVEKFLAAATKLGSGSLDEATIKKVGQLVQSFGGAHGASGCSRWARPQTSGTTAAALAGALLVLVVNLDQ